MKLLITLLFLVNPDSLLSGLGKSKIYKPYGGAIGDTTLTTSIPIEIEWDYKVLTIKGIVDYVEHFELNGKNLTAIHLKDGTIILSKGILSYSYGDKIKMKVKRPIPKEVRYTLGGVKRVITHKVNVEDRKLYLSLDMD